MQYASLIREVHQVAARRTSCSKLKTFKAESTTSEYYTHVKEMKKALADIWRWHL